ncbi:hypothetical protein HPB52_021100 [Rhipicephalus sanguineus]|uniref:Uncharacterized protein n=1 Tax=Rhipicephalus sanguineus TaxID=34632 RepID=A0A9D4PSD1_RHISA|nr:hypothetical protein HPB52_021100 [Rhipicephalus sanguineus]
MPTFCSVHAVCTPVGFARLFTVLGELVIKPKDEYQCAMMEEENLRRRTHIISHGSPGSRVAIAAIATDRKRFVGGVYFWTQDAQADSSSGDEGRLDEAAATRAYCAAEVAAAFGSIRRFCGDMEGTGMSHLDSLDKIEASIFNFISKTKKQAKVGDFFSHK